jgi:hypothetical protein
MNVLDERRKKARCGLRCRVVFFRQPSDPVAEGVTQNISSVGFYCLLPAPLSVGESLTCLLKMPSDGVATDGSFTLECLVRVVRLERVSEDGSFGIGWRIEGYRAHSAEGCRYKVCAV